ncbi:30582_t:CDS:2 [Gigaspora margarita]|uniref:30582_t:CDS:1 n=1 Tax=Gigaspora margarita TaxID=4874 RepID=A0ABM8VYA2_GIGMA|nr:30582_t:CDS:2 [Gigaspora margarita]
MLLKKNDLTDFTDKVCTELKHNEIILEFRHSMSVNVLLCYVLTRKACPALRGVYYNNNVVKEIKICDIEQFLEIANELLLDNTLVIYVTSAPVGLSRIAAKNVQDSVKDDLCAIVRKFEEMNKKFEKFETQGKVPAVALHQLADIVFFGVQPVAGSPHPVTSKPFTDQTLTGVTCRKVVLLHSTRGSSNISDPENIVIVYYFILYNYGMLESENTVMQNYEGIPKDHFKFYWDTLSKYGFRCHWGKYTPDNYGDHVSKLYPQYNQWMNIRRQMDPKQIFVTPYWRKLLKIPNPDN